MSLTPKEGAASNPLVAALDSYIQGRAPWPIAEAKKHHYVPQFILNGFVDPLDQRLHQLVLRDDAIVRVRPKEAGARGHLYKAHEQAAAHPNAIEAFFGVVESHAAPVVKRLQKNPGELSANDRLTLAVYIGLQEVRTPAGLQRLSQISEIGRAKFEREVIPNRESFRISWRNSSRPEALTSTDDEIERARRLWLDLLATGQVEQTDSRDHLLFALSETWSDLAANVERLDWILLVSPQNKPFVLGDAGLAIDDPLRRGSRVGPAWTSSEVSRAYVPLSPHVCLLIRNRPRSFSTRDATHEEVRWANLAAYGWSSHAVWASTSNAIERLRDLRDKFPTRIPRRGELGQLPVGWAPSPRTPHAQLDAVANLQLGMTSHSFRWTNGSK